MVQVAMNDEELVRLEIVHFMLFHVLIVILLLHLLWVQDSPEDGSDDELEKECYLEANNLPFVQMEKTVAIVLRTEAFKCLSSVWHCRTFLFSFLLQEDQLCLLHSVI